VVVTDSNGCVFSDSVSVGLGVGFEELVNNFIVLVYPNPVKNELFIELNNENGIQFDVFNVIGEQINSMKFQNSKNKVSTSNMVNGLYLYNIIDKSGTVVYQGKFNIIK